ncbi:hypothetical protein Mal48_29090 [Thalassoglobus polymorphus]|uniref:Uncharacterized protein n=1 Tax=Thalassoglobus polymorphus TaxID=2527994 RepID=A0A517QPV3_9PLAN|nr:hypothetical protein Mal48_29090 [Thalassoglobus polymorphus]
MKILSVHKKSFATGFKPGAKLNGNLKLVVALLSLRRDLSLVHRNVVSFSLAQEHLSWTLNALLFVLK